MTTLPESVRAYLARLGRKGGSTTGPTKARDPDKMRAAAKKRWAAAKPVRGEN
jgi:general stress protein YciG